jgi:LysM repeat protein
MISGTRNNRRWIVAAVLLALAPLTGFSQDINALIAGMREDIRILDERTRALTAEIEQLKRENAALREQAGANPQYVTLAQFNSSLSELEKALRAGDKELAVQLTQQMERLAKQMNDALATITKAANSRTTSPSIQFTPLPPNTTGVTYIVQQGETLASIAQRFGSTVRDIQNANQIADPKTLQAGQTIFIPQKSSP